jgi:protein SCO1/2
MNFTNDDLNLRNRNFKIAGLLLAAASFLPLPSMAEEAADAPEYYQLVADYKTPDVSVVRQDGKKLSFLKELDDGRPVIMNFVFASCSAICPMLSHIFSKVQGQLEKEGQKFHLVSISIDPENDTPAKLTEYAHKFEAGANWDFYTGTVQSSIAIQKAFNAYRGDKMNHSSVMVMRSAPGKKWVRLDGFVSPAVVIREFGKLKHE